MTVIFKVHVPNIDESFNSVDDSSINSAMESIALDGTTRLNGPISHTTAGMFQGQTNEHIWLIDDASLSTAQGNYSDFYSLYAWGLVTPSYTASTLVENG